MSKKNQVGLNLNRTNQLLINITYVNLLRDNIDTVKEILKVELKIDTKKRYTESLTLVNWWV
jgi:uncharacterized protein with PhoU and TrkA domain